MPAASELHPWLHEICKVCGRKNVAGFRVTNEMWKRVTGKTTGVLCINCFDDLAAEKGIDWTEEPIEFYTISTVASQKWADAVLFEEPGAFARKCKENVFWPEREEPDAPKNATCGHGESSWVGHRRCAGEHGETYGGGRRPDVPPPPPPIRAAFHEPEIVYDTPVKCASLPDSYRGTVVSPDNVGQLAANAQELAHRAVIEYGPPPAHPDYFERPIRPDPSLANPEARGASICWACDPYTEYTPGFGWWHRLFRGHWPRGRNTS